MQANNPGQGSNTNKQGGLSWSSPSPSNNSTSPLLGSAKMAAPASKASAPASSPAKIRKSDTDVAKARGNTAGGFIGGVVVGALLVWGWYALTPGAAPTKTSNSNTPNATQSGSVANTTGASGVMATPNTGSVGTNASPSTAVAGNISVNSPQDAGMDVVIANATVSVPTWIVVYEMMGNKPVRALGATMFFPEYNGKGGVVSLLRATQPGTTYFVGQAVDDGDHVFTPHVDKEVTDGSGNYAGVSFKTK